VSSVDVTSAVDGSFAASRNNVDIAAAATGPGVVHSAEWYYVETKIVAHPTAGSIELRVNGVVQINATNLNTSVDSASNQIRTVTVAVCNVVDDLYVLDSASDVNNTFLGDVRIDAHFPNQDGFHKAWTPSTGSDHWELVNETAPNTTDYNSTLDLNAIDTLSCEHLKNAGASLKAVQLNVCVTKDITGPCVMTPLIRVDSTDYPNATTFPPSEGSYEYIHQPYNKQPDGTNWNETDFNNSEFGYKKTG